MIKRLKGFTIVIPLHLSLSYPSDYVDQTAHILSQNNQVIFFDFRFPIIWQDVLKENNLTLYRQSLTSICKNNKEVYFRPISLLPFKRFEQISKINQLFGIIQLNILLKILGKKVILWGFDPIVKMVLGRLGEIISLYDCIDYVGEDRETKNAKYPEKVLFSKADIIAFNSQGLSDQKTKRNNLLRKKSFVTVCGCNVDLFQKNNKKIPDDLKSVKGNNIILAGVFNYRLDTKLLRYITLHNPKLDFIFVGPVLTDVNKEFLAVLMQKNVHYLGKKRKEELPVFFKNSGVGIIPYRTSLNFVKYSNPMKVYEYFAAGIPVVSTEIEALKNYSKDIIYTTDNYDQFSLALGRFLNNWNETARNKALKVAEKNSWENKIIKIEESILKQLKKNDSI